MNRIVEYYDNSAKYRLRTGEVAHLQQDPQGKWGFETDSGYNEWEAPERLSNGRTAAYDRLKMYEKKSLAEQRREQ